MNVTTCNRTGQDIVIKYWRNCNNCSHARFVIIKGILERGILAGTEHILKTVYLFHCPHVAFGKRNGPVHRKPNWSRQDIVPTSFTVNDYALENVGIVWQKFTGEALKNHDNMFYAEIPEKLWFEVFDLNPIANKQICPQCSDKNTPKIKSRS